MENRCEDVVLMAERRAVARSHCAGLRALRRVTDIVTKNIGLQDLLDSQFDTENTPPVDSDEAAWLKANDLLRYVQMRRHMKSASLTCDRSGHTFNPTSLAQPLVPQHDATIHDLALTTPSAQPSGPALVAAEVDGLAIKAAVTSPYPPSASEEPSASTDLQARISDLSETETQTTMPQTRLQKALQPDGPAAAPVDIAPPAADEEAELSSATKEFLDLEAPHRPAKTVHLPPEDVQEERLRERREAEEEERTKSDSDKLSKLSHTHAQELASSPSSTIDAYSAATPMPPQESPDTSPDSETAEAEVLPPKDMRPTPEEQHAKERHDRLLEAQKEIARKQALGDEATPDHQLRWEAREAAARDAEEQAARESVNGPEANAPDLLEETEAEQVMEDVQADAVTDQVVATALSLVQPLKQAQHTLGQDDGDNITVTPRQRLPPIDTSGEQHIPLPPRPSTEAAPAPPRMTTRVSSGAMSRKSVSEILAGTPTLPLESPRLRREFASPETVSPMTVRHPRETPRLAPAALLQTPRRQPQPSPPQRTPSNQYTALEDLSALRGAADDADRDYLEPLFRIQAHDSPNAKSKPLPNLVKDAAKYISTEDQFTSIHERMDYRILRRIYHLQNANKWSLRQMERCKEPAQPVTHHDHMMAEMKWMRKDFKAERKMKKSVCAWLAQRCAEWTAANAEERRRLQVKAKQMQPKDVVTGPQPVPELDLSGESGPEDVAGPATPVEGDDLFASLVVAPELTDVVTTLQKAGNLRKTLEPLPLTGYHQSAHKANTASLAPVSKFTESKLTPKASGPIRKRGRFDYDDEADTIEIDSRNKRQRSEEAEPPEELEVALFHPDNKHIRDRLHANNAFRPPSELVMPGTPFYEFRNGSQWIWEDDQKLRKLAKDYSFNWSLIADSLALPSRYKSSADRRSPWECFERWVELESLPVEMRKTIYFKTWFNRLETSSQAAERRFQVRAAAIQQQQAQNGQQLPLPTRQRITPSRVEKRKGNRYLWMTDAMRKLAKKRENNAYKQAEGTILWNWVSLT